jgi:diguanylate cyclase (GGDEF)-like protein/PAS domain S-box-containing protein
VLKAVLSNLVKSEPVIDSTPPDSFSSVFYDSEIDLEQNQDTSSYSLKESREKKQLRQALKDNQKRYAIATEITSDGIWEWDLSHNQIRYSSRWKSTIGYSDRQITDCPTEWLNRVHPDSRKHLEHNLTACRKGRISEFEIEYPLLHKNGRYRHMYCKCAAVTNIRGEVSHLIGSQIDISQHRATIPSNDPASYDRLTNLPNRQLFIQKLEELSRQKQAQNDSFAILCLDLDRFKNVNRNFGHQIGDRLLIKIVAQLKSFLQTKDLLARLGSDEFAILLTGFSDLNYPTKFAAHIQQQFSQPIEVEEHFVFISVSIGIALAASLDKYSQLNIPQSNSSSPTQNQGVGEVCRQAKKRMARHFSKCRINLVESLQNAETAMQQAKGRQACNIMFESAIYLQNLQQSKSEDELRKAIEQEQFELHYQPVIRLEDRQLVGFEALIRWQHPRLGLIPPAEFISLAENTGLIMPMGWWVLRSACAQMRQWHQQYDANLFISVNITAKQFSQPYAADIIVQIIEQTALNPHDLKLEITESEIIENINLVLPTAEKLKSLGIQLSMDDFGTGYSSLSYLHCLPIDTLKIDRCFIRGIDSDRHQLELVRTIIRLAELFELDIVAEGIETEQHCSQLLDLKCKYGQGYLFHKPLSVASATQLLN